MKTSNKENKTKKKKKTKNKYVAIKRRIIPDNNLIHFIRHNSNKRRHLWNKFVEAYYEYQKEGLYFNSKDANLLREYLIGKDEELIKDSDTDDVIKDMYCSDIPLSVYKDVCTAFEIMKTKWKKEHKHSDLQYKKYDPFRRSFSVRTSNTFNNDNGNPMGKVHFKDIYTFEFRASNNHIENTYIINLKESIADNYDSDKYKFTVNDKYSGKVRFTFKHDDIKNISFKEELGKFYIILMVKPKYHYDNINKKNREEVAGIDLGIRNPVTIYDGNGIANIHRIDNKSMSRMQYYERKTRKLQSIMIHKYKINKAKHLVDPKYPKYSKRYRKIQKRFRRYWKKITDIRRNWRYKIASYIINHYKTIIVDEYKIPDNSKKDELSNSDKRYYNHYNRQHGMYLFMETLRYMCVKNDCKFKEAPKRTTRRCSTCNHVNKALPLGEKYLVCSECNAVIDRDINAAINCYNSYF